MGNEAGEWIIHGVTWDDPKCIHDVDEAVEYINRVGFLPLFKNEIPGFSLEERTVAEYWWSDDPVRDPWRWRIAIAKKHDILYGKFFAKKAGFISKKWLPVFANYRRDGYDFDALWDDEKASIRQKKIMDFYLEENAEAEAGRRKALYELLTLKSDLDQTKESMRKQALEEAKAEADRILDGFEGDMQKKNFEIERLTSELQKKEYEISWLRAKLDSMTDVPVLIAGDEDDFYPGEAKDFVLSAVKKELSATEVRTRRYDVLSDILNVNNYEAIGEQRAEEAKRLLSNYSGMTQKLRKGLEDIGFIFDQSDHQKVKYYGDDRYTIIYASTPSDKGHGGKNNVRNTIKKAF